MFSTSRTRAAAAALGITALAWTGVPGSATAAVADPGTCTDWVALTFDDGPSHYRPQTLQILRDKQVPAVFFDIGVRVDANPQLSAFQQREGHQVLNHTYTHPRLGDLSALRVRQQILEGERALVDAGVEMPFDAVRPPFGSMSETASDVLDDLGYSSIGVDVLAADWLPETTADDIYEAIVPAVEPGDIILMHDGPIDSVAGSAVIEAMPRVIDGVRAEGLCFGLVNADGEVVPAEYVSSGEPIPSILNPVPFRPLAFGDAMDYPFRILPADLPAFETPEQLAAAPDAFLALVDGYVDAGRLDARVAAQLRTGVQRVETWHEQGRDDAIAWELRRQVRTLEQNRHLIPDDEVWHHLVDHAIGILEAMAEQGQDR